MRSGQTGPARGPPRPALSASDGRSGPSQRRARAFQPPDQSAQSESAIERGPQSLEGTVILPENTSWYATNVQEKCQIAKSSANI